MDNPILDKYQASIYFNLMQIWVANPSQRFNQLVNNLQWEFNNQNDDRLRREDNGTIDAFYLGDKEFSEFLQKMIDKNT